MADTETLTSMLTNIIDNNNEQAQIDFHQYVTGKFQDVLGQAPAPTQDIQQTETPND